MSVYGRNYRRGSYQPRQLAGRANSDIPPAPKPLPEPEQPAPEPPKIGKAPAGSAPQPNSSALLGNLMPGSIDSDTLLIAALLLILMKEGGDIKLVLALGYILL